MSARITEAMVEAGAAPILDILNTAALAFPTDPASKRLAMRLSRACLAAALPTEPGEAEGMVLVPREPTREILDAIVRECKLAWGVRSDNKRIPTRQASEWREIAKPFYSAMQAAAPLPEDTHHGR